MKHIGDSMVLIVILIIISCALASWAINAIILRFRHLHEHLSADKHLTGPQKIHESPVPRIGGLGVIISALLFALVAHFVFHQSMLLLLILTALPVFLCGFLEDLTKRVSWSVRLLGAFFSAVLAAVFLDAVLIRLDLPVVDSLLPNIPLLAIAFTIFAVAGVTNAMNIIDGLNGLSAGSALVMFFAFAIISYRTNDHEILVGVLSTIGATSGFLIWNWPRGLLFLGDGGAYLLGFLLAEVAILLVVRHPNLTPWASLLVCVYPVTETLYSIYRRNIRKSRSATKPDASHLHSLIYRRVLRRSSAVMLFGVALNANAASALYLWILTGTSACAGVVAASEVSLAVLSVALFVIAYHALYMSIVRFKTRRWILPNVVICPRKKKSERQLAMSGVACVAPPRNLKDSDSFF